MERSKALKIGVTMWLAGLAGAAGTIMLGVHRESVTNDKADRDSVAVACVDALRESRQNKDNAANTVMDNCSNTSATNILKYERLVNKEDDFIGPAILVFTGVTAVGALMIPGTDNTVRDSDEVSSTEA